MKNVFTLILVTTISLLSAQNKPRVVSSASMIYDMVANIAGDKVSNNVIVPIGGDPHIYNPTPSDATLVSTADLIFINALTFEGWILELIANSGTSAQVDTVTKGIDPIQSSKYKNAFDPHAWMDVSNGLIYIENIKNSLVNLDPENSAFYENNYAIYKKKLEDLDKYIYKRIQEIPEEHRVLITSHDAFAYYGKRYGLQLEAIQGMSTEAEARTSDVVRIVNVIKKSQIPVIFIESTISPKLIQQIAVDNNVEVGGELFADSIGDEKSGANSYYDMLKKNTDTIVDALTGIKLGVSKYKYESASNTLLYSIIGLFFFIGIVVVLLKLK